MRSVVVLSDIELLEMLRSDDKAAFSEIYNRYWKQLFTIAANKTGSPEEAEELVQDIFSSLWTRRVSLEIHTTLSAYLSVSVKYRVLKVLAKRFQYSKYVDHSLKFADESHNSTEDWLDFEELRSRVEVLVAALPEKCRLVYKSSREEGLSQKQIANQFGISEKTVEAHIGKALKTLRTGLGQLLL